MLWTITCLIYFAIIFWISQYIVEQNKVLGIWILIVWLVTLFMLIKIFLVFYGVL